jgi:hypothetical protein
MSSASRKFRSSRGREKFASALAVTDQNWVGKVVATTRRPANKKGDIFKQAAFSRS